MVSLTSRSRRGIVHRPFDFHTLFFFLQVAFILETAAVKLTIRFLTPAVLAAIVFDGVI